MKSEIMLYQGIKKRKVNIQTLQKDKKNDYLKMYFSTKSPNEIWVSDITYYNFKGSEVIN